MVRTSKPSFVSLSRMLYLRIPIILSFCLWSCILHVSAEQVTVKAGDTLSSLALAHNTTIEELKYINNLPNQNIKVGDVLFTTMPFQDIEVQWGDTLSSIATKHNLSVAELLEINSLEDNAVVVGQFLRVPRYQTRTSILVVQTPPGEERAEEALEEAVEEATTSEVAIAVVANETIEDSSSSNANEGVYEVIIQPGDTLSSIAAEYQVSVSMLMELNNLSSTRIRMGDILFISPTTSPESLERITVAKGDNLSVIAERHGTSVTELRQANNLDTDNIREGQTLLLPRNAVSPSDAPPEFYIVQENDALYNIALAYGLSVDDLVAANNLNGTTIYAGQVLQLEADAATAEKRELIQVEIARGETLSHIAARYDIDIDSLTAANHMSQWDTLSIGQKLVVPGHFVGESTVLASAGDADRGGIAQQTIRVARGDTLSTIAHRYNTNVAALMSENRLSNTRIRAGQSLRVTPGEGLLPPAGRYAAAPAHGSELNIIWPLRGTITSRYGHRTLNGMYNNHTGLDIDGVMGDPIVAAISGRVIHSGRRGGYGKAIVIRNGNYDYIYAHASKLLVNVGEFVEQGQRIALVGNTGTVYSTTGDGTHLHFEIRHNGVTVNPLHYLNEASR